MKYMAKVHVGKAKNEKCVFPCHDKKFPVITCLIIPYGLTRSYQKWA